LLRVELNGVAIHENIELFGPTRGAVSIGEVAKGPLRLQGDHGAVAFRNVVVTHFVKPRLELADLKYTIYPGKHMKEPQYDKLPPEAEGPLDILTSSLNAQGREFLIRYTGTIIAKEAGEYTFNLNAPGGAGLMKVNNQNVVPIKEWNSQGTVELPAGKVPFELVYTKF
jgi:hypothetical protein